MPTEPTSGRLPERFRNLQYLEAWILPTSKERQAKRVSSTRDQVNELYKGVSPQIDEIIEFLNGYPLDALPDDVRSLFYLAMSVAETGPYAEWYGGEPESPLTRGLGARLEMIAEPA